MMNRDHVAVEEDVWDVQRPIVTSPVPSDTVDLVATRGRKAVGRGPVVEMLVNAISCLADRTEHTEVPAVSAAMMETVGMPCSTARGEPVVRSSQKPSAVTARN